MTIVQTKTKYLKCFRLETIECVELSLVRLVLLYQDIYGIIVVIRKAIAPKFSVWKYLFRRLNDAEDLQNSRTLIIKVLF